MVRSSPRSSSVHLLVFAACELAHAAAGKLGKSHSGSTKNLFQDEADTMKLFIVAAITSALKTRQVQE
jgi:hypothetical protein